MILLSVSIVIFAGKRLLPGDRFKQNAAERKNVGTMIDLFRLALRLFGRHVTHRAENQARR